MEPARYFVVVIRRDKRACRDCAAGVGAELRMARIINKGLIRDGMAIKCHPG
jgi:hypothetical protein